MVEYVGLLEVMASGLLALNLCASIYRVYEEIRDAPNIVKESIEDKKNIDKNMEQLTKLMPEIDKKMGTT